MGARIPSFMLLKTCFAKYASQKLVQKEKKTNDEVKGSDHLKF